MHWEFRRHGQLLVMTEGSGWASFLPVAGMSWGSVEGDMCDGLALETVRICSDDERMHHMFGTRIRREKVTLAVMASQAYVVRWAVSATYTT
jgi:hypothetical protein